MKKATKKLLTLGALSTAIIPLAATISCGKEIVEVIIQDNRPKPKAEVKPEIHFNGNPTGDFAEAGDRVDIEYTGYFKGDEILGGKTVKTNIEIGSATDIPNIALTLRIAEMNLEVGKEQFASILMPSNFPVNELKNQIVHYKIKITKLTKAATNHNTIKREVAEQYDKVTFDVFGTKDSDGSFLVGQKQYGKIIASLNDDPAAARMPYEAGIVGMRQGEEKEIHYTYPSDHPTASLRNQSVTFLIIMHKIEKTVHFTQSNISAFNSTPTGSFAEIGDTVNIEFTPYFNGTALPIGKKVVNNHVVGQVHQDIDAMLAERIKEAHLEVNKEQTIYVLPRVGTYRNKLLTYKVKVTSLTKAAANHNVVDANVIQQGDKVNFDFIGFVKGTGIQFLGGTSSHYVLNSLDKPASFIPGYEAQMVGLHVGETKLVNVTFPANYSSANLRNKQATFVVIVHAITKPDKVVPATLTPFNAAPAGSFAEAGDTVNLEFTPYLNGVALPSGQKVIHNFVLGQAHSDIDAALAKRIKEVRLEVNKEQTIYVLPTTGAYRNKLLTYKIKITSLTKAAANSNAVDSTIIDQHDTVAFDFIGYVDATGEQFHGGTSANYTLRSIIDPASFIPGFETQMAGLHVGETKLVHVTFPANYQQASLRNKQSTFVVIIHSIVKHP